MNELRVLLADDHVLMLESLKRILQPVCTVVGTAADGGKLIDLAKKLLPDIILVDLYMPALNGLYACEVIKSTVGSKIIVVTITEDPVVAAEAFQRGALGYVLKKNLAAELVEAIQTVALGRPYISPSVKTDRINVIMADTGSDRREER